MCISKNHKILYNGKWVTAQELFSFGKFLSDGIMYLDTSGNYYNVVSPSTEDEMKSELKQYNSDGRKSCIACGGKIIEPYPKIRYCPKCE